MLDPISLSLAAKLFFILKQYLFVLPMVKKSLLQLMREAHAAKVIEQQRVQVLRNQVSAGSWYRYVMVHYLVEALFYCVILHSLLGVHTLWLSLLFALEDWCAYWLTILVPYWFANRWERQLGITQGHAKVIDLIADPAHAEALAKKRARERDG